MTRTIEAIYENGILRPLRPLAGIAEKQRVRLTLRPVARGTDPAAGVITRRRGICGRAPTVSGTRICVHDIVAYAELYEGDIERMHREELPELSREQIDAALVYYQEHRAEIDNLLLTRRAAYEDGIRQRRGSS